MPRIAAVQNRQPGEYVSSEVAAPARGQNEATVYRVVLDPNAAALNDTALTIDLALEGSIDGTNWTQYAKIEGWQGGMIGRDGSLTPPRLSWMSSDNRVLTRVRARWTQNRTARMGANLEVEARDVSATQGSGPEFATPEEVSDLARDIVAFFGPLIRDWAQGSQPAD